MDKSNIRVKSVKLLKEFIELARCESIVRVLLAEYTSVEAVEKNGGTVLMGMVWIVVTAFGVDKGIIYRWYEQVPAKDSVKIMASTGNGHNRGSAMVARKEIIRSILRDERFEVDDGEWTPASAQAYLHEKERILG